jgi:hypothetical protein
MVSTGGAYPQAAARASSTTDVNARIWHFFPLAPLYFLPARTNIKSARLFRRSPPPFRDPFSSYSNNALAAWGQIDA